MPEDNVHEMWSDADLDTALATLQSDVDTDSARLDAARRELFGPAAPSPVAPVARGAWVRWAAAAAAVAVLVGAVFVVLARRGGHEDAPRPATPPTPVVQRIKAADEPLGPGQFRYVGSHAWLLGQSDTYAMLAETGTETWVPDREQRDWMQHRTVSGRRKFLFGSEKDVQQEPNGLWPTGTQHARCGDFYVGPAEQCKGEGHWGGPDEEFMSSLPRDPRQLYDRLSEEAKGGQGHEHNMFTTAADLLRTGRVPADLRLAVYRTLAKLPHLEVTEQVANLDGRTGVSLAITGPATRDAIIIDPATGQFIGERIVTTIADMGVPPDKIIVDTAITYGVVDHQGEKPR
jgi:hypothetical protein